MTTRFLVLALLWLGLPTAAMAQGCGQNNPNCIVPTAPLGTSDNRAASTAFVGNATRTRLTGALDLYADFVAGNDANTCLSAVAACKTVQAAYGRIYLNYDTAGQVVTIHMANNDPTCLVIGVPWVGGGQVVVAGPGSSTVQPTVGFVGCPANGVSVSTTLPNSLTLSNLALSSGANSYTLAHTGIGQVVLSNVVFGNAGQAHIFLNGAGAKVSCQPATIVTTTAGVPSGAWAAVGAGGALFCPNTKFVFLGTQSYVVVALASATGNMYLLSTSFCSAYSQTICPAVTTVSGVRFNISQNGVIDTGTSNVNLLPGNSPGVLTNGGVFN